MSSSKVRILVPTSRRKRSGGSRAYTFSEAQQERTTNRFPSLTTTRRKAVRALLSAINGQGQAASIFRAAGERLEVVTQRNLAFHRAPLLPSIERETGPLFRELEGERLSREARCRLRAQLILVCPLLGLLAPTDLVPEYSCPVGAQTRNDVRSLHHLWKPVVTETLNRICRGRLVFSFLPSRMRSLWRPGASVGPLVEIRFVRPVKNGWRHEHAGAGRLSGELLRHILNEGISDVRGLAAFESSGGHRFSPELSRTEGREQMLVFARP